MQDVKTPPWLLIIFLAMVVGAVGGIALTWTGIRAAPSQPIAFRHRTHSETGVPCLFCHSGAVRSDIAGIPSVQRCMGCHAVIATDSQAVQAVTDYWERDEPIPWRRVNNQPEFVYFSHQPHLGAGINCETCHGDVGGMRATHPVIDMDMGWCLDCHLEQPEADIPRLTDCLTCHK